MLFRLAALLRPYFGPARLLQSYTVLITLALYIGYLVTYWLLPKFYDKLPHDRGREFTAAAALAKGKPTGSGVVFISIFVLICFLFAPLSWVQTVIIILTWFTMLTGYLDDRSTTSWGEYRKAFLDLVVSVAAAVVLYYGLRDENGAISYWLPFTSRTLTVWPWLHILISTVLIWASINTTNCTDGVDGLSSTLVLIALITMGVIFYFILGHKDIAAYLLVPHLEDGAKWAIITFALAGVLMGYLWHNAFPSNVLMGDAGSRALGFFIAVTVIVSGNPFLILATSTVIFVDGGLGLLKVALMRFCKIKIFQKVRFPLHDHVRQVHGWSPTHVLVKFMILQLLCTVAVIGLIFKIR